jgi:hypothetical protein
MIAQKWYLFKCRNPLCEWSTPGCYNFEDDPKLVGCLPDTDCPKCKCHDSVVDTERELPQPDDLEAIRKDIADGASYPEA